MPNNIHIIIPEKGRKRRFHHALPCDAIFGGGADSLMSVGLSDSNHVNVLLMGSHAGPTVTFCYY